MEGTKARTMKTAEEFLKENGISFSQTSKDVFGNELLKLMEQFRKEGMKKAWNESYYDLFLRRKDRTFEEWYNNQIKEA